MAVTPNYNLSVYSATDTSVKFLDFRTSIAGTSQSSNFYIIDTVLKQFSDSITVLQNDPSAYQVNAIYVSANFYAATVAGMTSYKKGQLIILSLDTTNVGTVTVNINNIGTVSVMKYTSTGTIVNMEDGDIRKNSQVLCMYDGTRFVTIGFTTADQINVIGTVGDVLTISANNTIQDSGKKIGAANGIATLDSSGNVVEKANQLVNTLTVQGNGVNIGTFDGSTAQTLNITPANIGAATTAQGAKADALVDGTTPAGDSTKLNGKVSDYYLYNPNLFDNSNFLNPVNQRGLSSVTQYGYFIDRWEIGYSHPALAQVDSNGITITAGSEPVTLRQTIDNTNIQDEYTLSICTSNDEIYSTTGTPTSEQLFTTPFGNMRIDVNNGRVNVMFVVMASKTMSLKWAKLEKGSVPTPYVPKEYGVELLECQRYYLHKVGKGCSGYLIGPTSRAVIFIPTPIRMRSTPTGTLFLGDNIIWQNQWVEAQSIVSIINYPNGVLATIQCAGAPITGVSNTTCSAYAIAINLSADL